jgi:hypothetical protein
MLFQRSKQADCPKSGHQPFHERIFDTYVGEKLSQKLIKSPLMVRHRFEMNVETGRGAEEALRGKGRGSGKWQERPDTALCLSSFAAGNQNIPITNLLAQCKVLKE